MNNLLERIQDDLGGFGSSRIQNIKDSFTCSEELEEALYVAYKDKDTTRLENVNKIGCGYALKLARWYGREMNLSDGKAEATKIHSTYIAG